VDFLKLNSGKWKWSRWGCLIIAVIGVLMTPQAIINAIQLYKSDHKLGFVMPLAFALRFAQIWVFAWVWWKTRPVPKTLSGSD